MDSIAQYQSLSLKAREQGALCSMRRGEAAKMAEELSPKLSLLVAETKKLQSQAIEIIYYIRREM